MTKFTRHCQSAPERKCDRVPQCVLDCDFDCDTAGDDLPIEQDAIGEDEERPHMRAGTRWMGD